MAFKHKLSRRLALAYPLVSALCSLTLLACQPGETLSSPDDEQSLPANLQRTKKAQGRIVSISVAPDSALLSPGGRQMFAATATLRDSSQVPVTVTSTASAGTIDSTGAYTAPAAAGVY